MEYTDILGIIATSNLDNNELDKLIRLCKASKNTQTFKVGDIVELSGLSPKKVNGLHVVITKVNRSRVVADVPGSGLANIPMSCCTIVS